MLKIHIASEQRRIYIDLTSRPHIAVDTTLFRRNVPVGYFLLLPKFQAMVVVAYFNFA